ncbi:MAG TPA: RNA polymerase sigma-70 factor [Puia sp.]|nr:RNA polymerase sigma-70 factor [Puia sp.]
MNPEEEKIWRSIQLKDEQSFEQYYKSQYKFLLLAACKYLGEASLAQELVNDVFMKLWQDADQITIQSSLRSYLYRAVVNRCLNELDKTKRTRVQQQELIRLTEESSEFKDMENNELKMRLYLAIDQLPEQCRKVFLMSRFEELKQQVIADRLGISIKTVKNHITHALQRLHRVLEEWDSLPLWIVMIKYFFWLRH